MQNSCTNTHNMIGACRSLSNNFFATRAKCKKLNEDKVRRDLSDMAMVC